MIWTFLTLLSWHFVWWKIVANLHKIEIRKSLQWTNGVCSARNKEDWWKVECTKRGKKKEKMVKGEKGEKEGATERTDGNESARNIVQTTRLLGNNKNNSNQSVGAVLRRLHESWMESAHARANYTTTTTTTTNLERKTKWQALTGAAADADVVEAWAPAYLPRSKWRIYVGIMFFVYALFC